MLCKINYLGFDTNLALQDAYQELITRHKPEGTDVRIVLKDSSTISPGDVPGDVDTIFTSPPYWSSPRVLKERYENMPVYENEEDFNMRFLSPMVRTTWNVLKPGGYFCINTNHRQYEDLKKIIGREADRFIELMKRTRGRGDTYKEYIYVWLRGEAL
jgi:methylase of polypeptide subunit release factors